jgi:hypothetical protein
VSPSIVLRWVHRQRNCALFRVRMSLRLDRFWGNLASAPRVDHGDDRLFEGLFLPAVFLWLASSSFCGDPKAQRFWKEQPCPVSPRLRCLRLTATPAA